MGCLRVWKEEEGSLLAAVALRRWDNLTHGATSPQALNISSWESKFSAKTNGHAGPVHNIPFDVAGLEEARSSLRIVDAQFLKPSN